jgi:hypothetical protein
MVNDSLYDLVIDLEGENTAAKLLVQSGIKFELHRCTDGKISGGGRAYFNLELSSDGVWIESWGEECKTPGKAKESFEARLNGYRVLERMPELDSTGKQVGERAIVVKIAEDGGYRATIVAYGPDYCAVISSSSLRHLLAYRELTGF